MSLSMQHEREREKKRRKPVSNKPHPKFVTQKTEMKQNKCRRKTKTKTEPMSAIGYVKKSTLYWRWNRPTNREIFLSNLYIGLTIGQIKWTNISILYGWVESFNIENPSCEERTLKRTNWDPRVQPNSRSQY